MGVLKDVMDTLKDIDMYETAEKFMKTKRYSSLSKRAQEGTLQFPTLISSSMDIQTAQMITKSLERKYTSFIMIATTMAPTMVVKKGSADVTSYLRQFHQNTGDRHNKLNLVNDIVSLGESMSIIEAEKTIMFATICEGSTGNVVKANKLQLTSVMESFRKDILNNKFMPKQATYLFENDELSSYHNGYTPLLEANSQEVNLNVKVPNSSTGTSNSRGKEHVVVSDKLLRDNDVKKANELVPTTLHLKVKLVSEDHTDLGNTDFLIGIKATMHPVDSDDMITNVVGACRSRNGLFKFIKWTTGEISFVKDLMLNISEIKEDVVRRSSGSSPWWLTLKRRQKIASMKNTTLLPTGLLPNTALVITMEEANHIRSQYGFDLLNPSFVDKIMKEYFLITFVIVDSATEMAYFMFEGQRDYEIITFNGLERDAKDNKGIDAREVVKMMNRI